MKPIDNHYDVIIIGAGPAGTTAATLLARSGKNVLLLEKDSFPRYNLGESLLPYCYFTLDRLGMIEKMKASAFPKKYSVQFVSTNGQVAHPFYFHQHFKHEAATTWQVLRSDFDQMLLDNAIENGAKVIHQITAKNLMTTNGAVIGVEAIDQENRCREFYAPMTIDASGRAAFACGVNGWRVRDPELKKVSIWTYYKQAKRDPGLDAGATTIAYLPEKGWFWYIPLPDDTVSVGIVAERDYLFRHSRDRETIFQNEIKNNPWIEDHLSTGQRTGPYHITGDYSYRARHCAADGIVLVGDAFTFLDPVFSSGVFLALKSGELAADIIDNAFKTHDFSAGQFSPYYQSLSQSIEVMRKLLYAFYDQDFSFGDFLKKYPELRGDLTDCLIGNLAKDFSSLFQAVGDMASLPDPIAHGQPLTAVE